MNTPDFHPKPGCCYKFVGLFEGEILDEKLL